MDTRDLGPDFWAGSQTVPLPGAVTGQIAVGITFETPPVAGSVWIETRAIGSASWVVASDPLPYSGDLGFVTYGMIQQVRARSSGLTGGTGAKLWFALQPPMGFPSGSFVGLRALTTQGYTEANVKNGTQYEASDYTGSLANGASRDTIMIVGALPVLVKARQVEFNGTRLEARVFRAPVYTGGSVVPYYNLNDRNPVAGLAQIIGGATVSNPGIQIAATDTIIGSDGLGNTRIASFVSVGAERLLDAGQTYLLRLTNLSGSACAVSAYVTWYQGGTDLPLPS